MRKTLVKTVSEYILNSPIESQKIQLELRRIILSSATYITESISWGVPFYKLNGPLCGFAVYKQHVSFGGIENLKQDMKDELKELGYTTGSKTIQIKFTQMVPTIQIKKILHSQVKINTLTTDL
jgi:uncharacterized protein